MNNKLNKDPTLPPQLVEAINERCDIGFLLGRHATAAEARIAAEFCTGADLMIPELLAWTDEDLLGANALTHQGVPGYRPSYNEVTAAKALLQGTSMSHSEYGREFYRNIRGNGALVRYADPPRNSSKAHALGVLQDSLLAEQSESGEFLAAVGLHGQPFDRALSLFRQSYEKERLAHRWRELHTRHAIADLLGDIVFGDILGDVDGTCKVRTTFGLAHDITPDFFSEAGINVTVTKTMILRQTPGVTLQHKSGNGDAINDLDIARALVDPVLKDASYGLAAEQLDGREPTLEDLLAMYESVAQQVTLPIARELWESS